MMIAEQAQKTAPMIKALTDAGITPDEAA
jgi:hypothetical protein